MRVTRATEYAIRCILYLASMQDRLISRQEIAYAMEIPEHFLAKIAQSLAKAQLIEIQQGRRGGYRLLLPPEEISLLNIIEATEGEIFLNECVFQPNKCRKSPTCRVHQIWKKARDTLRGLLSQVKIADLLQKKEDLCFRLPEKKHES